ncbi:MAG TPA: DUF2330 domain-containing protein [Actinomycetes bacterium]|jgi:hypothetical protein|nr:DUF2330 domain-containing protein [Actinomycetes bacterium]
MARRGVVGLGTLLVVLLGAQPAWACAGLVGKGGTVRLARTATLAAYGGGVEHYLTAFTYAGGGAEFGSIVPLPGVPTDVRKGGGWTLQRLARETQPVPEAAAGVALTSLDARAEVLLKTRIDALDITIVRGGGAAVGAWARRQGFDLSVDAPEVLDFYASRSPVFMAATFDARAATARGQQLGDGTPIQLAIPTANPWVPLRILGLGHQPSEPVQADVYLLTERRPALLPAPRRAVGLDLERSEWASPQLLGDLRADKNMGWLPADRMYLSYLRVDATAGQLSYDLAVDASGRGRPSRVAAGLAGVPTPASLPAAPGLAGAWAWYAAGLAVAAALAVALRRRARAAG